ncbi:hypothetical protein B0T12DRAFT_494114 [Alternaria alternata]|nr:hypothetical protein B0T12DRAFT_494114 [Alternaria alternata]
MPSYGPWTWSAPHNRHYSYYLADDGVTVLDTLWSGPVTGPATPQPPATAQSYENTARTPRTGVNVPVPFIPQHPQPSSGSSSHINAATYLSRSNDQRSSSRQLHRSTGSGHDTRTGEVDNYPQQQYGYGTGIGSSRNGAEGGTNYTTEPYGVPSPQSYPSAHASITTASGGSPYLQQSYQAQTSYPFTPSSPRQSQQTTPSGATGHLSQYPGPRRSVTSLPVDVQSTIQSKDRRYIQTNLNESSNHEQLDTSKLRNTFINQHMLTCARVSASCAAVACGVLCQWPGGYNSLTDATMLLTKRS